jgi:crotonobetainyl-CoA:carnitine CoA-transferase CaiB-like acyl-CoA transferase
VIYARMSGFGHDGPHHDYRSYGPVIQAICGLSFNSGLPGREPSGWGLSHMDNQAAYYNSAALLLAIYARTVTGEGCEIDVSAEEIGINLLGPDLLDTLVNGRPSRRPDFPRGNRVEFPPTAPHGVYPASGDDEWIAIAVVDDPAWAALVTEMGSPAWATEPGLSTVDGRVARHDELDARLGAWTKNFAKHDLMHRLQAAGVPAGAVQNSRDLVEADPQIAARGTFFELDHPVIGPALFEGSPMRFSRIEQDNWRSAPLLGEDNDYVFGDLLGLSGDEMADLSERGAI